MSERATKDLERRREGDGREGGGQEVHGLLHTELARGGVC